MNRGRSTAGPHGSLRAAGVVTLAVVTAIAVAGCGGDERSRNAASPRGAGEAGPGGAARVVSLAPALTQMVRDLGKADVLVGVAENDDAAPPGLAVVGTFMDINRERLLKVEPTHVLAMTGATGRVRWLERAAEPMGLKLGIYRYPRSIEDVADVLYLPRGATGSGAHPSVGRLLGVEEAAAELRRRMLAQMAALKAVTAEVPKPRVLLVFSVDPNVMASGPGSVLDSLLAYVGAENAAGQAATSAPVFDREKLLALDPAVVVLLLPNAPPLEGIERDRRLAIFRGLDIAAVREGRIHLIGDPLVLLPSTTLPRIAAKMAEAIHPGMSETIGAVMESASSGSAAGADAQASKRAGGR